MCVEFDDDRKHIVVLQQIGKLLKHCGRPRKIERIRAQARKYAEYSIRSRCTLFVIHDETQRLAIRTGASAALHRFRSAGCVFKGIEPETEAILFVPRLEFRIIASAGDGHPANHDRVIDRVGEHRSHTRRRKYIRGQHRVSGIFRAGEREQIGEISCRITDLPWPIYMV